MHMAKGWAIGRVTSAGPKLDHPSEPGKHPTCSFWLEVRTVRPDGMAYTRYLPVQIVGKRSEEIAEELEAGDELYVEANLAKILVTYMAGSADLTGPPTTHAGALGEKSASTLVGRSPARGAG
jgi:hypothetical protein